MTGAGNLTTVVDDSDLPMNMGPCSAPTCSNGMPGVVSINDGSACGGMAGYVCSGGFCSFAGSSSSGGSNSSSSSSSSTGGGIGCMDNVMDNMETGVDCGGPVCLKCAGSACSSSNQCHSLVCLANVCQ